MWHLPHGHQKCMAHSAWHTCCQVRDVKLSTYISLKGQCLSSSPPHRIMSLFTTEAVWPLQHAAMLHSSCSDVTLFMRRCHTLYAAMLHSSCSNVTLFMQQCHTLHAAMSHSSCSDVTLFMQRRRHTLHVCDRSAPASRWGSNSSTPRLVPFQTVVAQHSHASTKACDDTWSDQGHANRSVDDSRHSPRRDRGDVDPLPKP